MLCTWSFTQSISIFWDGVGTHTHQAFFFTAFLLNLSYCCVCTAERKTYTFPSLYCLWHSTSLSSALLSYRQMKWPPGYNVIVPGGGLVTGQQRQRHGNVQLCPRHLPECGQEFPAPGTPGVSLHPDPLHRSPPQGLGGHLQGTSYTYHSCFYSHHASNTPSSIINTGLHQTFINLNHLCYKEIFRDWNYSQPITEVFVEWIMC